MGSPALPLYIILHIAPLSTCPRVQLVPHTGRTATNTNTIHSTANIATGPGSLAAAPAGSTTGYLEVAHTPQGRGAAAESVTESPDETASRCRQTRKELSIADSADDGLSAGANAEANAEAERKAAPVKAQLRHVDPNECARGLHFLSSLPCRNLCCLRSMMHWCRGACLGVGVSAVFLPSC